MIQSAINVQISTKLNNLYHYKELVVRSLGDQNWLQTNKSYYNINPTTPYLIVPTNYIIFRCYTVTLLPSL